jgi:hypothetical protein
VRDSPPVPGLSIRCRDRVSVCRKHRFGVSCVPLVLCLAGCRTRTVAWRTRTTQTKCTRPSPKPRNLSCTHVLLSQIRRQLQERQDNPPAACR